MLITLYIIVTIFIDSSFGAVKNLRYETINTNGSVVGLACALEKFPDARGTRFNTQTHECESLPDTWYLSKTIDLAYQYFIRTMAEDSFEPTINHVEDIPAYFTVGCTTRVYFRTATLDSNSRLAFKFWVKPGFMPFTYGLGYYSAAHDHIVSLKDNKLGAYIYPEPRLDDSNTVYKVDFLYTQTHYEISVDDVPVYKFKRRYTDLVDVPTSFECKSDRYGDCTRVQWICPSSD